MYNDRLQIFWRKLNGSIYFSPSILVLMFVLLISEAFVGCKEPPTVTAEQNEDIPVILALTANPLTSEIGKEMTFAYHVTHTSPIDSVTILFGEGSASYSILGNGKTNLQDSVHFIYLYSGLKEVSLSVYSGTRSASKSIKVMIDSVKDALVIDTLFVTDYIFDVEKEITFNYSVTSSQVVDSLRFIFDEENVSRFIAGKGLSVFSDTINNTYQTGGTKTAILKVYSHGMVAIKSITLQVEEPPFIISRQPGTTWTYRYIYSIGSKSGSLYSKQQYVTRSGIHKWLLTSIDSDSQVLVYHFLSQQTDTVWAKSYDYNASQSTILDTVYQIIQEVPFNVTVDKDSIHFMWCSTLLPPQPIPLLDYNWMVRQFLPECQVFSRDRSTVVYGKDYDSSPYNVVTYYNRSGNISYSFNQWGMTGGRVESFKLVGSP